MICQNQVQCLRCNSTPYSSHRHHYSACNCGAISVDGGRDYLRRVGNGPFKELSYSMEDTILQECQKEMKEMQDSGRNDLGILLGVFRVLRKHGRLIAEGEKKND